MKFTFAFCHKNYHMADRHRRGRRRRHCRGRRRC